jgi:hypothetical protein
MGLRPGIGRASHGKIPEEPAIRRKSRFRQCFRDYGRGSIFSFSSKDPDKTPAPATLPLASLLGRISGFWISFQHS